MNKEEYRNLFFITLIGLVFVVLFNIFLIFPKLEEARYNSAYLCRSESHFNVCINDVYYPDSDIACFYPSNGDIFEDSFCIKDFIKINSSDTT